MAKYKLIENGVKREDGAFIPNDPRNSDWRDYQEWVAKGNAPQSADPEFSEEQLQEKAARKSRKKAIVQKLGLTKQDIKALAELVQDANDD